MDKSHLRAELTDSSRASIDMMAAKAKQSEELRLLCLELALDEIPQVSSRASRVLESCVQMDISTLKNFSARLIKAIPDISDSSIRRSFLKIYTTAPLPEDEEEQGILLDSCFRYLSDINEPPAVKVYAMDILYRFTRYYPEISKELLLTLEEMGRRETPSLCAHSKLLMKLLSQNITDMDLPV